jgi:L-asparagine permease
VLLMPFADADQRVAFFLVPVLIAAIALGWVVLGRRRAAAPARPVVDPAD